jgi:hypothetical protein
MAKNSGVRLRAALVAAIVGVLGLSGFGAWVGRADQPPGDAVGRIEGEAISVTGPMSIEVVAGQTQTVLRSGADVRVKSGMARIDLVEGGQITICGPAHFSVLKSGGALTIALDSGTVHAYTQGEPAITFYTAQIKAQSIAVMDPNEETLVGFDAAGALCVRASRGAVRLENQLTGQSLIVPQSGDVLITNGQFETLKTNAGHCVCELQLAKSAPSQPQTKPEVSRLASPEELAKRPPNAKRAPPTDDDVTYTVYNPPLVYDAKKKVQPEFDPNLIVLVRRVRVRPTLIFYGRVEGETIAANSAPPSPELSSPARQSAPLPAASPKPATPPSDSFFDRLKTFMRRLWSGIQ